MSSDKQHLLGDDSDHYERVRSRASRTSFAEIHDSDVPAAHLQYGDASSISSIVNLTNTIVGGGVLGLPFAVASCGYILGSILLFGAAALTVFSCHLLILSSTKIPYPKSFYHVAEASVPQLTFLIDMALALLCFGVGSSYLIVIGGLMPDVMDQLGTGGIWEDRATWIIIGFCIVAPLSALKQLDALKYTSAVSIVFVFFIAAVVFFYSLDLPDLDPCKQDDDGDDDECIGDRTSVTFTLDTVRVFGIFIFAYTCQTNVFTMVNELRVPTQYRYDRIVMISILTALFLYAVVALAGYQTYGSDVEDNILINYPKSALASAARVSVSLLVAFSYPLLCHPARLSAMALWRQFDTDIESGEKWTEFRYYVLTAAYVGGTFVVALSISDLGLILGIIGSTGSSMICYILPGISYWVLFKDEGPVWKRYAALAMAIFGMIVMPVCLTTLFI